MYGKSAEIYDLLYTGLGIKNFEAEAAQLREVIELARPGARSLLDVACGTGAFLAEMRRWYEVEGVDASPDMLRVARRRLPDTPLKQADMRTFSLRRRFDAVTCLFSSIAYITDAGELRPVVARLAEHVAPGGLLILDGWVRPDAWNDEYRAQPEVASDEGTIVVRLVFTKREGEITEMDMHHLVRTEQGIEHFSEHHRLRLVRTDEYVAAVEAAGLTARVAPNYMPNRDRVIGIRPNR